LRAERLHTGKLIDERKRKIGNADCRVYLDHAHEIILLSRLCHNPRKPGLQGSEPVAASPSRRLRCRRIAPADRRIPEAMMNIERRILRADPFAIPSSNEKTRTGR
jgi:hypothetical protein